MTERVACAVLAAGASRRLGYPKQLALHRGLPLVRWAALCATRSVASETAVVLGAHARRVADAVSDLPIMLLDNPGWREGIAASIRSATLWAQSTRCTALLLVLCDQPHLTSQHLSRLIQCFEHSQLLVASRYANKNAVPAVFPRPYFAELAALRGDSGAGRLLNDGALVVDVLWPEGELDVDTAADARALLAEAAEFGASKW